MVAARCARCIALPAGPLSPVLVIEQPAHPTLEPAVPAHSQLQMPSLSPTMTQASKRLGERAPAHICCTCSGIAALLSGLVHPSHLVFRIHSQHASLHAGRAVYNAHKRPVQLWWRRLLSGLHTLLPRFPHPPPPAAALPNTHTTTYASWHVPLAMYPQLTTQCTPTGQHCCLGEEGGRHYWSG